MSLLRGVHQGEDAGQKASANASYVITARRC